MTPTLQLLEDDAKQGDSVALAEAAREHIDELVKHGVVRPDDATSRLQSALRLLIQAQAELDAATVEYPLSVEVNLAKCEMNAARRKLVMVVAELGREPFVFEPEEWEVQDGK